jgi:carbonic anhydrase
MYTASEAYMNLLKNNEDWANKKVQDDPEYFSRLKDLQQPEFLWIGCSDSRVPANEITGTQPGEIFVHRNVANLVLNTDVNLLSVLEYSVNVLKVKHIIVCGHYGCGGVKAATTNHDHKIVLNMWLRNIKDVYRFHRDELEVLNEEQRVDRLVELNVEEQLKNLAKTSIIQRAWKQRQAPTLHGWVYSLGNGKVKSILDIVPGTEIDPLYTFDDL